jgi:hypothetical protein
VTDAGEGAYAPSVPPTRDDGAQSRWVGRATAPPRADPWPTTEQPVYEVLPPAASGQQPRVVYAQPPRRRGIGTLLVIAGILAACCGGGATIALISSAAIRDAIGISSANPPGPEPTTQTPPTTPALPADAGLNTPVRDGKFEFVVTSVSCGHKSVGVGPISAKAKGEFCLVDLSVENIGDSGQLLIDGVQRGFDADGTEYGPDPGAGVIASGGTSTWLSMIDPGKTVTGTIVYDLPKGDELARLEFHDSPFSRGVSVILSG